VVNGGGEGGFRGVVVVFSLEQRIARGLDLSRPMLRHRVGVCCGPNGDRSKGLKQQRAGACGGTNSKRSKGSKRSKVLERSLGAR